MMRLKSIVTYLLLLSISLSPLARARLVYASPNAQDETADKNRKGLRFRLSEGAEQSERPVALPTPATTKISDSEVESILKRLPPVKAEAQDEQDFALRDRSLPPPRTGKTISVSFPPPAEKPQPEAAAAGPLEVLRFAPEGEVSLAPQLSVTFSQPMVAVTSQEEAAEVVPVRLTPQPPGRWRWVGTKTLLFVPEGRFPMATEYSVTVPAGTRAAQGGGALAGAKTWTFATPPPQVKSTYPQGNSVRRDQLMFVEFDQRIDPAAVLRTIRVMGGGAALTPRLATPEEVAGDETVRKLADNAEKGRWLALRVVDKTGDARLALPGDSPISVTIGPGTPSAEGPRTTTKPQSFSFRTYGSFRVIKSQCSYNRDCSPFDTWSIEFSNPVDAATFDQSKIRVEPAIEGMKTSLYGNWLTISGVKKGRTLYKVTIDRSLSDSFGQQLEGNNVFTFNVGRAPQMLYSSRDIFSVLDPNGPSRLSVYTVNYDKLKVSLYSVAPTDWNQFLEYMRWVNNYNSDPKKKPPVPGRQVFSKLVDVTAKPDEIVETGIDLSQALDNGLGQVIVIIEPPVVVKNQERQTIRQWVQSTNIGLEAFVDRTELLGWANSLKDGRPLEGVEMTIEPGTVSKGVSGSNGLARLTLPESSTAKGTNLLVARQGRDVAILPESAYWWNNEGSWRRGSLSDYLSWYVFDDRKMYRPNEEVHIKGWIRRVGGGEQGDVGALGDAVASVSYTLHDSRGNEITKGAMKLNALGGFDTTLKLPATMNLGYASLRLEAEGGSVDVAGRSFSHSFQVQEFRRPEFEVSTKASEGPLFVGNHATTTVTASYYAGGGLPNAEVRWRVTSKPTQYTPPNRSDFIFGTWIPWWISRGDDGEETSQEFSARTDALGKHNLRIDFDSVNPARPSSVVAQASVTDVNRQTWASSTTMLVHPADLYVGLKSDRTFVQKGEPLNVQTIVTDLDGKAVEGREVRMRAVLLDWEYEGGQWKEKEKNPQDCVVRSTSAPVKCTFQTKEGGSYRVSASVMDDRERRNESEMRLWVAGGKTIPKRDVEQETVELIPDRKEYKPGDTAEILVQSPFTPAEGVLTLRRSGIVRTERFRMDGPSTTLRIPIEEAFIPNIYAQVDLVGAATRTTDSGEPLEKLPKRPAFASGSLNLSVPPLSRKLNVEATPRDKALEPGSQTVVNVEVKDAQGQPVAGSEVAVVVVDESVLALTGYKLDDPLSVFYRQRSSDTRDYHLRENVLLSNPDQLAAMGGGGAGGASGALAETVTVTGGNANAMDAAAPPPRPAAQRMMTNGRAAKEAAQGAEPGIRLRENFNALAVFAPAVPTDSQGRAQVEVKIPDNLTRYRVMAVSVAGGKQFGSGESAITARLPLMARPSAPRFLNFGDRFELPVVLQNQTDQPMTISLAVRATNAELTDGAGRSVTVPANDRVEVRFPVAANKAGTARFQVGAVSGKWTDAAELSLPVWTPATTEAFATYGVIDEGAISQPVKAPANIFTQFGGLEISTSSTELQELTDVVLYLVSYPYECSEQLASRVLGIAALRDVLAAFKAKGLPPPEELKAAVTRDLKRLEGMQNDDGGFGFWRRGEKSWPYVSIHVAHSLQRAKEKGFDVPAEMLDKSKRYLRDIEKRIPAFYGPQARRAVIAYALYVRNRMGDRDVARARSLINEAGLEGLSMESVGWLLSVLTGDAGSTKELDAIRRHLNNRVTETAGMAHFVSSYSDSDYLLLNSDRRADGVILEALIIDQPQNDLIPKIVRGLMAHRSRGRWQNTQENVFILLALDRYFATFERVTPNFVARAWLGQRFAGEQAYRGRTTERQQINVPMRYLAESGDVQSLTISKEGQGRLYYRIGMQYAPSNLKLEAADYGFAVERVYEAVDNPSDVTRDADGTWRIKAGARVRVRLTMAAPARRYHVALVDPLPAGLEALNPALAVTEEVPEDPQAEAQQKSYWWWYRPWFEHQNMRDERVEAFTSLLWEGVYTYSYVARATTPGNFVVPPTKAEEMYHPETFGRGKSDRVVIE